MGPASQFLSATTAVISVIGVWARSATEAASKIDEAITKVIDKFDQEVAADSKVIDAQTALDAAQASAATAAAGLQEAQEELARAQAEATNATLPAQMLQLVSSRIQDQSYSKELTTYSLARADLDALSTLLRDQRKIATGQAPSADDLVSTARAKDVDRVILYIDDLDRCRPRDVVRVLQIVHMLLAFDLFIVVVAVDARWVEESLMQSYRWLSSNDSDAPGELATDGDAQRRTSGVTPQDYLEKIFQICFWLEPMTSTRAASFIASLVRPSTRESSLDSGTTQAQPNGAGSPTPTTSKIEIATVELDYMKSLAKYVGSSPRRVKRLVNSYRLIKARLTDSQLNTFLPESTTLNGSQRSAPYQIVICLLVIGTGAPSTSARILKELAEWDPNDKMTNVVEQFYNRNDPDWTMAAQVIETLTRLHVTQNVAELRGWARQVGRFLQGGQAADFRLDAIRPTPNNR
jgi:hypothetical protein